MANVQIQTGSDNTVKAYEFLEANAGNAFTIAEVAAELGLTSAQVTGGLVSLAKKEVVIRAEKTGKDKNGVEKTYKSFEMNPEYVVEFVSKQKSDGRLSDNGVIVLQYLQANPTSELTHAELAEALGYKSIQVVGAATALEKKGFITKPEVEITMPDGAVKTLKVIALTEEGKAYKF